jgi:hypothetical protein
MVGMVVVVFVVGFLYPVCTDPYVKKLKGWSFFFPPKGK